MKKPVYFVPVDFTGPSYNALQYAMEIAKVSKGNIKLFHVLDSEKLSDSGNPLIVERSVDRLKFQAEKSILSLCEIISETGIKVTYETVLGNINREILSQVNSTCPDLIIMGKKSCGVDARAGRRIADIANNTAIPLLVIPGSTSPRLPNKIALMEEKRESKAKGRISFFESKRKITEALSILNFGSQDVARDNSGKTVDTTFSGINNKVLLKQIIEFYRNSEADMLCATKQKQTIFNGIFRKNITNALVKSLDTPFLLVDNACPNLLDVIQKVILEKKLVC